MGVSGSVLLTVLSHRWENVYKDSTWGWWLLAQNLLPQAANTAGEICDNQKRQEENLLAKNRNPEGGLAFNPTSVDTLHQISRHCQLSQVIVRNKITPYLYHIQT